MESHTNLLQAQGCSGTNSTSRPPAKGKALLSPVWAHVTTCRLDPRVMGDARSQQTGEANVTEESCEPRRGLFWGELLCVSVLKASVGISAKRVP